MPRTLLIGSSTGVWRAWLREHLGERQMCCLDPADADFGFPGRLARYAGERCLEWRFMGSLSVQRAPHVAMTAISRLCRELSADAVIEAFPYRPSPIRLQMIRLATEILAPDITIVDRRTQLDHRGWPCEVEEIDLPESPAPAAQQAHRKARWLQLIEQCEVHELDLRHVAVEGLRLGSGVPIPLENLRKCGFEEPLHGETAGSSLLIVSDDEVGDVEVSRALDLTHTSKAHVVSSRTYANLLCAFSRSDGEDFAMGRIEGIDFPNRVVRIQATAVPETPVALLRVGGLRLDADGRELGELKPWDA